MWVCGGGAGPAVLAMGTWHAGRGRSGPAIVPSRVPTCMSGCTSWVGPEKEGPFSFWIGFLSAPPIQSIHLLPLTANGWWLWWSSPF